MQCKGRRRISWVKEIAESISHASGPYLHVWRMQADRCLPLVCMLVDDFYGLLKNGGAFVLEKKAFEIEKGKTSVLIKLKRKEPDGTGDDED
jgi:hypothetical protein